MIIIIIIIIIPATHPKLLKYQVGFTKRVATWTVARCGCYSSWANAS